MQGVTTKLKKLCESLDKCPQIPYVVLYMNNRERLEQIIDLETPLAEAGCLTAQSLVINAQAELDELDQKEAKGIIIDSLLDL